MIILDGIELEPSPVYSQLPHDQIGRNRTGAFFKISKNSSTFLLKKSIRSIWLSPKLLYVGIYWTEPPPDFGLHLIKTPPDRIRIRCLSVPWIRDVHPGSYFRELKGIDRPFELRGKFVPKWKTWGLANFFSHFKGSWSRDEQKPLDAA